MDEKYRIIRKATPTLDKKGVFAFFYNRKCASMSIQRYALKDRVVVRKDDSCSYYKKLSEMTDDDLDRLFKFTFVRNPYERVVSAWHYLQTHGFMKKHMGAGQTFEEFVLSHNIPSIDPHFHHQHEHLFYGNVPIVDFIGKVENIREDFSFIAKRIGFDGDLGKKNTTQHDNWQMYYENPAVRQKVAETYKKDFELLNYEVV